MVGLAESFFLWGGRRVPVINSGKGFPQEKAEPAPNLLIIFRWSCSRALIGNRYKALEAGSSIRLNTTGKDIDQRLAAGRGGGDNDLLSFLRILSRASAWWGYSPGNPLF